MPPALTPSAARSGKPQPFLDPQQIAALYADMARVDRRSNTLLDAKTSGKHVGEHVAHLLASAAPHLTANPALIADLGCGNGRPTRAVAQHFPQANMLAIDASTTMLSAARAHLHNRLGADADRIAYLRADFHQLPIADAAIDAATAIFCLYHSTDPSKAITEIARSLTPGGAALLVTKSTNSYHELDELLAQTGIDPDATGRPSLYQSAAGHLLPDIAATALTVDAVIRDEHTFCFRTAQHLADYLTTVPKYHLPSSLHTDPEALAAELRRRRGDEPATTTSTITYVVGHRPQRP
ncbi:class I SAM-dependent methyltransferase [Spirillospora sp. NBC_00431]